jgi:hypothetical protein
MDKTKKIIYEATITPYMFEGKRTVLILFRDVTHFNEMKVLK